MLYYSCIRIVLVLGLAYGPHFRNQIRNWTYFILDYNFINNWWSSMKNVPVPFNEHALCVCVCVRSRFFLLLYGAYLTNSLTTAITIIIIHTHDHSNCWKNDVLIWENLVIINVLLMSFREPEYDIKWWCGYTRPDSNGRVMKFNEIVCKTSWVWNYVEQEHLIERVWMDDNFTKDAPYSSSFYCVLLLSPNGPLCVVKVLSG